jgi:hypothetical protein
MTLNVPWTPDVDGDTTIFVELDNTRNIKELNEENNELDVSIMVDQKDKPLFDNSFVIAGLMTMLIIVAGVGIYVLTFRNKVEDHEKDEDEEMVDDHEKVEDKEKEE